MSEPRVVADSEWADAWRRELPRVWKHEKDDDGFLLNASRLVAGLVLSAPPEDVWMHRIDNWFGDRWLGFSAKVMGAFGVRTALEKTKRADVEETGLVIPPFHPNRMTGAKRVTRPDLEPREHEHLHRWQEGGENRKRYICDVSENGLFVWWSGNTLANGRGSFLVYRSVGRSATGMYVELERRGPSGLAESWRVVRSLGLDAGEVLQLIEAGCRARA